MTDSYWLSLQDNFWEGSTHWKTKLTYSKLSNAKNWESIPTKSILNAYRSNEANNENKILKNLRLKNLEKVIIGHININSLRNKFELLTEMLRELICCWFQKQSLIIYSQTLNFTWNLARNHTDLLGIAKEKV